MILGIVVAIVAASGLVVPPAVAAEPVDLELVLAADGSGSIDDDELRLQRQGYAQAITHPRILAAIRSGYRQAIVVAYIEWGGPTSQHTIVPSTLIRDEATARAFAERLVAEPRQAQGYNSISGAIDYAMGVIRDNAFDGQRKVIDVSGDGPHIGGRPVLLARNDAVAAGATINGLVIDTRGGGFRGFAGQPLSVHYELEVIGGPGAFVEVARDRSDFPDVVLRKMIREIAGDPGTVAATEAAPEGVERR